MVSIHHLFIVGNCLQGIRIQAENCRARRLRELAQARSIALVSYLPVFRKGSTSAPLGTSLSKNRRGRLNPARPVYNRLPLYFSINPVTRFFSGRE